MKLLQTPFLLLFLLSSFSICSLSTAQESRPSGYSISSNEYGYSVIFPAKPQVTKNEKRKIGKVWKEFVIYEFKDSQRGIEYVFESFILPPELFKNGKYDLKQYFEEAVAALFGDKNYFTSQVTSTPQKEIHEITLDSIPGKEIRVLTNEKSFASPSPSSIQRETEKVLSKPAPAGEVKVTRKTLWLKMYADPKTGKAYNIVVRFNSKDSNLPEVQQFINSLRFEKRE